MRSGDKGLTLMNFYIGRVWWAVEMGGEGVGPLGLGDGCAKPHVHMFNQSYGPPHRV